MKKRKWKKQRSAKQKLNSAHFLGAIVVSSLIGLLTQSWAMFLLSLVALLAAAYHAGDIRS